MNILLQKLLMRGRYMAPAQDDELGGGAGGSDIDDDDDDDVEIDPAPAAKPEVKLGDQDDGSVIVEIDEEGGENGAQQPNDVDPAGQKAAGEEDQDDEAAREKIREARRLERKERKERAKEREEEVKRELAAERAARKELEARLAGLEGRDRSREIAGVDANIKRTETVYDQAKAAYIEAVEQHDGEAAAAAQETMSLARERYQQLTTARKAYEHQQAAPKSAVDPELVNHAQKFMSENKWYNHGGSDMDSRIVKAIDDTLTEEGKFHPSTPAYWDELRARIKKVLPHRINGGKMSTNATEKADAGDKKPAAPARQQKTVVGGGGGESAGAGKGTFHLSPERVQAIKDAGMWDDPKARQDMIRRFRDFDKTSKG